MESKFNYSTSVRFYTEFPHIYVVGLFNSDYVLFEEQAEAYDRTDDVSVSHFTRRRQEKTGYLPHILR